MSVIKIENLTKDYGGNKGVFDVSFEINKGEVFGFLGPNGAGKTTTIRHLLGFSKPDSGKVSICEKDCWTQSKEIHKKLGYLPGEIVFPNDMKGIEFIRYIARLRGLDDLSKANRLLQLFELDPSDELKRMSKGMKQKIGLVCAFMHDPDVLILDEPTSGLDPLMQSVFVELIKQEKDNGKSILMSSHIFGEIEGTCDRLGIIKAGRLEKVAQSNEIFNGNSKEFQIEFKNEADFLSMKDCGFTIVGVNPSKKQMKIKVSDNVLNDFIFELSKRDVHHLTEIQSSLENYFMEYYSGRE